ncbi:hypothetical protein GCM10027093_61350 [Paraburkholderia jirisanensis]
MLIRLAQNPAKIYEKVGLERRDTAGYMEFGKVDVGLYVVLHASSCAWRLRLYDLDWQSKTRNILANVC